MPPGRRIAFASTGNSGSDSDDDGSGGRAGGAFALLADADGANGGWEEVRVKKSALKTSAVHGKGSSGASTKGNLSAVPTTSAQAAAIREQVAALRAGKSVVNTTSTAARPVARPASSTPPAAPRAPHYAQQQERIQIRTHDANGKPLTEDYYKTFCKCFLNEHTGETVLRLHKTDIVRVKMNGDVVLSTGGWFTASTLNAMNEALNLIGIEVRSVGPVADKSWTVKDAYGRQSYYDGILLEAKSAADKSRGQILLQGFQQLTTEFLRQHGVSHTHPSRPAAPAQPPAGQQTQSRPAGAAHAPGSSQARPAQPNAYHAAYARAQGASGAGGSSSNAPPAAAPPVCVEPPPKADLTPRDFDQFLQGEEHGDEEVCIVCWEKPRGTICVPCGHLIMCGACAQDTFAKPDPECPYCRAKLEEFVELG
mmetsp:Transcript_6315/g.13925  ORF Transcript_6315/g.13925 Transcript_6315/m.13925 type:complete len:424 (+) Transcript_6315:109-1380(+)|eukprot:CAMPEP_0202895832 /NCGR_PEP_ID=MMETSP1392-20130828/4956_1 /ASSEMBLY_ACC=CAM_ASM_000868 /TAXON_ID=225041 /ORGANISM="Chlamydomonas chlamydogama, Strain SAG 11-48b" /LENGTH=423 /DNA_ID=CAMNT_0049580977 /DNA_START=41 /DNA_END=1312 /DNA_ORIENTATION=+